AVGVSLLAAAMFHDLPEGGSRGLQTLMVAGLMHDVGELYIDPTFLQPGTRLAPEQWKHMAAHPIIGARVLGQMPGAGPQVAQAVLYHHERLDGFGYPHGLRDARLPMPGQVLALAEMLMGLIESGRSPGERASVATKLIPGEFNRRLLDRVAGATKVAAAAGTAEVNQMPVHTVDELVTMVLRLDATLQRLHEMRSGVEERIRSGSSALKELMAHVIERCERIRLAFSSTGLDTHGPKELRDCLAAMEPHVHSEVTIVLREIEWRLREVKRETRLRAERLPSVEAALVRDLIEQNKRREQQDAADASSNPALQATAA
ncbi:MAG TPA: HD domain-containing phosphohydrolase, partial [Burkholderiaceae bacterium]|nr:HD domain-containing phosphohydrolase [Burkholderiaceae bacterium]